MSDAQNSMVKAKAGPWRRICGPVSSIGSKLHQISIRQELIQLDLVKRGQENDFKIMNPKGKQSASFL